MRAPNNILEHCYNLITYRLTLSKATSSFDSPKINESLQPLWISGMFRSGTSIVTKLVQLLGTDLGPENDLLQPIGHRKHLNPSGFYENYLLMDFSMHVFKLLNAWGDQPPAIEMVRNFDLSTIDYKTFVFDSIVNIHDDRISNNNKKRILSEYYPGNLEHYFTQQFKTPFAVKNPHFLLLFPLLDHYFTNGYYLVVFRNPIDSITSAKQVTRNANEHLYQQYYVNILDHPKALFLDYDTLIKKPEQSIERLAEALNMKNQPDLATHVKRNSKPFNYNGISDDVISLHQMLQKKALNNS